MSSISNYKGEISLRYDYSVEEIASITDATLAKMKSVQEEIVALPLDKVTFQNTILKLAALERESTQTTVEFLQHVSANKEVRDASVEANKKSSAFEVKFQMSVEMYQRVKQCQTNKAIYDPLDEESKRLVDRLCRDSERLGLNKDENTRKEIERILTEMSELSIQYGKNLGEENTILLFAPEELEGMPQDFLDGLKKSESEAGKVEVTLKYPHVLPIQDKCENPKVRAAVEKAFNQRCMDTNPKILERLVALRAQAASLLGYESHADYVLEVRMAKSASAVKEFLSSLNDKLEPLAAKEREDLLELKKEECEKRGEPFTGTLQMSDFRYYLRKRQNKLFDVDQEQIKEYFPLQTVTDGLLSIYQNLLKLKFTRIDDAPTWHPDVVTYRVTNDDEEGELIGYFYLDLHPREGKYGHAACFTMQSGCNTKMDGHKQVPVAACVCNFPKPDPSQPKSSLLPHNQVRTFYHEFGHVCHVLCAKTQYTMFAGTRVERDFVEAPSQMLESWVWKYESLQLMSGHYKDPSKPLPEDLAKKLANSREANSGLLSKRQLLFATFDQALHTKSPEEADTVSTSAVLAELQPKILGIEMTKDTNFAGSFGHLAGGYDAQYYGYLWSEVFAMDMFVTKFETGNNLLNQEVGMQYRRSILQPGGSRDAIEHLKEFLGREPIQEAFLKSKGL